MSEVIEKVIKVDVTGAMDALEDLGEEVESTSKSFKSLKEVKAEIDRLTASLVDLDSESEEYAETVNEVKSLQDRLNKALSDTSSTVGAAAGSYNALVKEMAELKKKWKATNDEAERKSLAKQITGINDKLKEMDASIGNYQRNVGNYQSAFISGLQNIADKIKGIGNPLQAAKAGVKALGSVFKEALANPFGAFIMAIVGALKLLKKGFDGSETATNSLKRAFSSFEPIINSVKNAFTTVANTIGKIAENAIPAMISGLQKAGEWIMSVLNKVGLVSDETLENYRKRIEEQKEEMQLSQELTDREIKLTERRRQFIVREAKDQEQISALRAKAADKDKYTAEERQKYLKQAIAVEKALNKEKLDIAQEDYNIEKQRSELTDNTAEDNERLAKKEAELYNVRREYNEAEMKLIKELNAAKNEQLATDDKLLKKKEELNKKEYEDFLNEQKLIEQYQDEAYLSTLTDTQKEIDLENRKYQEKLELFKKYNLDTEILEKEHQNKMQDLFTKLYTDELQKKEDSVNNKYDLDKWYVEHSLELEPDKTLKMLEIEQQRLDEIKKLYEEKLILSSTRLLDPEVTEEEKESIRAYIAEIDKLLEQNNTLLIENADQVKQTQKRAALETVNQYSSMVNSIGNLMGDIASFWQDNIKQRQKAGKITEAEARKEFENSKKLQIATAIINGLAGIATAVSTAMELGPIAGPIVGAVNSAIVATTTGLEIAKIMSTTYDGGSSGSSSVSAPSTTAVSPSEYATAYSPQYSQNVTTESDTDNLSNALRSAQQDLRVYVVESDITEAQGRVKVRESESTF